MSKTLRIRDKLERQRGKTSSVNFQRFAETRQREREGDSGENMIVNY